MLVMESDHPRLSHWDGLYLVIKERKVVGW